MTRTRILFLLASVLLPAVPAAAQAPPFFGGGGGIFDPEIDVVESGILLDAQAVVSADRKYVTLTNRFQNTDLISIQEFAFQVGAGGGPGGQLGGGQVGGAGAAEGVGRGAEGRASPARRGAGTATDVSNFTTSPVSKKPYPAPGKTATLPGPSVLEKQGMTLISKVAPD
jgi:hypothetical protein